MSETEKELTSQQREPLLAAYDYLEETMIAWRNAIRHKKLHDVVWQWTDVKEAFQSLEGYMAFLEEEDT